MRARRGGRGAAARALTALLLLVGAAGCTGGDAEPSGSVTIRLVTGTDLSNDQVREDLISRFESENDDIEVETVQLPAGADGQRSQLLAALQSGNPDGYDIVNLDVVSTAEFAHAELISPLRGELLEQVTELDEDGKYWEKIADTVAWDDRLWAVPWNTDAGLLFYRADVLGPGFQPRDWQELAAAAGKARRTAGFTAGLVTQLGAYEGLTVNIHEAVWRGGGEIVHTTDPGTRKARHEVRVDRPTAPEALKQLGDALAVPADPDRVPVIGAESVDADESASTGAFLAGRALMMRNWPVAYGQLFDELDRPDSPGLRYGVATMPGPTVLGGQNLAVVSGIPDRERSAAEKLIADLTGEPSQKRLVASGFVPPRKDALETRCGGGARGRFCEEYHRALRAALERAQPRPVTPYYGAVTRDIQDWLHGWLARRAQQGPGETGDLPPVGELADALEVSLGGGGANHMEEPG
ncbi:extracellular solute-binding protein [Streptomyces sp. NPDC051940]|uniref:extracellular solute-binding protein n=1 Tax=Streptomyces sp. NPDC051940 TaxID=3155675 RepID=UPI00341E54C0